MCFLAKVINMKFIDSFQDLEGKTIAGTSILLHQEDNLQYQFLAIVTTNKEVLFTNVKTYDQYLNHDEELIAGTYDRYRFLSNEDVIRFLNNCNIGYQEIKTICKLATKKNKSRQSKLTAIHEEIRKLQRQADIIREEWR